jgi:hypothetical protein
VIIAAWLAALIAGQCDPLAPAALGDYRLKASCAELEAALTGRFRDIHALEIGMTAAPGYGPVTRIGSL